MTMFEEEQQGSNPHTSPEEGHPAGDGERSDRDIGGPTSPEQEPSEDVEGGGPGTKPGDEGFDSH